MVVYVCRSPLPLKGLQAINIPSSFVAWMSWHPHLEEQAGLGCWVLSLKRMCSPTVTFGSGMLCIIYTSAKFKCSALQWAGTGASRFRSPSSRFAAWKCSTSETLSCTSVYLCLLIGMRLALLRALFSPHLSYQISLHPCPHLALIFICILPWPTEGTQLIFDGACGGFWSSDRIRTCWDG